MIVSYFIEVIWFILCKISSLRVCVQKIYIDKKILKIRIKGGKVFNFLFIIFRCIYLQIEPSKYRVIFVINYSHINNKFFKNNHTIQYNYNNILLKKNVLLHISHIFYIRYPIIK